MPGVIDVKSHHIEHPRLVAERLERYAEIVGKERVIAGTDCGFSTMVGWTNIDPEISWAKLESLVEGARIASERLW
jgi:5-methyltetrahydropteroyltriglutamate--homocysteine methyltransferase